MPDFDFPNSPTTNQVYTANGVSWRWNGVYWVKFSTSIGAQGSQGHQGSQGSQGSQGTDGAQGAAGAQGSAGAQGNQGLTGGAGAQGSQGHQGIAGAQGAAGAQGNAGAQGDNGAQGAQGHQGHQGDQGLTGAQGNTGAQGAQGHQGHQGHQGQNGTNAGQGAQGDDGAQCAQGHQGNQGGLSTFAVPSGGIIIWSGAANAIPGGWVLCNGANNTPDLRNRFVVGHGSSFAVDATGGSADAILVSHSHTVTGSTNNDTHNHGISDPGHRHNVAYSNSDSGDGVIEESGQGFNGYEPTEPATTGITIISDTHSHSVSGSTNSQGSSATNANLPPYYALCYIMKT